MVDPLIGEQLGDYVIQRLLGRGGMARVYVGYDERLQRYAAVKVIHSDLLTVSDRAEYAERFRREARAIARLNHPNIVGVYQFGEYEEGYYMAMVFVEGKDLRHLLHDYEVAGERMPLMEVLNIVRGIASALDYAHSRGVIHRDVKPANLIISVENTPILTDFGLAMSAAEGSLGDTFGSAHYIAPEQAISSARAVPQSDQYSLGVCLYEMLAGRVPFDDPSAMSVALKHLNEPPPPLRDRAPDLPPAIEAVVMKALAKDPAERYPTVTDMAHALAAAVFDNQGDISAGQLGFAGRDPASVYDDEAWPDEKPTPRSAPTPGRRLPGDAQSEPPSLTRRGAGGRRLAALGVLVVLAALAVAALLALRAPSRVAGVLDQTPTAALAASYTSERTPSPTATGAPTIAAEPTYTATSAAPLAPTDRGSATAPPSATLVRVWRATTAPTQPADAPTLPPTVTPSLVGELLLRYDSSQIDMINLGDRELDLTALDFVQRLPEAVYTFSNSRWTNVQGAARQPERIPPGWCLQVARLDVGLPERFDECRFRAAYMLVADSSWFWLPGPGRRSGSFEVRIEGRVIATCEIGQGACRFNLPRRP